MGFKAHSRDQDWRFSLGSEETGATTLQKVIHLIQTEDEKSLVDVQLASCEVIKATAEHPFYEVTSQTWKEAEELTDQSVLVSLQQDQVRIIDIEAYTQPTKVYNLTVAHDHTYFVGREQNADACIPIRSIRTGYIIYGESAQGSAGGFHSILALQIPGRKIINTGFKDYRGVYEATIAIKNPISGRWKTKLSTMYPNSWDEKRIVQ